MTLRIQKVVFALVEQERSSGGTCRQVEDLGRHDRVIAAVVLGPQPAFSPREHPMNQWGAQRSALPSDPAELVSAPLCEPIADRNVIR